MSVNTPRLLRMNLRASFEDQHMSVLVDTGSTLNIVKPALISKLGITPSVLPCPFPVFASSGTHLECHHICVAVPLFIQGHKFSVDLFVIATTNSDLILGVPWLQTLGPVTMNFSLLTMSFEHSGRNVTLLGEENVVPMIISSSAPTNKEEDYVKTTSKYVGNVPRSPLLCMYASFKRQRMSVIIDTGSVSSFIKPAVVSKLGITPSAIPSFSTKDISGALHESHQQCVAMPLLIQGHKLSVDLRVLDMEWYDIILGVQWLQTLGTVTMDFSRLTISFEHFGRNITLGRENVHLVRKNEVNLKATKKGGKKNKVNIKTPKKAGQPNQGGNHSANTNASSSCRRRSSLLSTFNNLSI